MRSAVSFARTAGSVAIVVGFVGGCGETSPGGSDAADAGAPDATTVVDAAATDAAVRDASAPLDAGPLSDGAVDSGVRPPSPFVGCEVGETRPCSELAATFASGDAACRTDRTGFDVSTCTRAVRTYGNEIVKPAERDPERWGDALANNGRPWSFEVSLSPTGSDVWVIRLGGGGFCDDDLLTCVDRGPLAKGVGAADGVDVEPDKYNGIRERFTEGPTGSTPNEGRNAFWDANFAQFNYRSSDLWLGESLEESDTSCRDEDCVISETGPDSCSSPTLPNGAACTGRWFRRGRINIRAGVEALIQRYGLDDRTARVLFVGTSAGSFGVLHSADVVSERLPQAAARGDLLVVPDGAWAVAFDDPRYRLGDQYSRNTRPDIEAFARSFSRFSATPLATCVRGQARRGLGPETCIESRVTYEWLTRTPAEGGLGLPVYVQKSLMDTIEVGFHRSGTTGTSILESAPALAGWVSTQRSSLADAAWLFSGECMYHTTVETSAWWDRVSPSLTAFFEASETPMRVTEGVCGPPECSTSSECNDGNPRTTDVCGSRVCINRECVVDADCDDGNADTEDLCRGNRCIARECYRNADCNDGDPGTPDRCRNYECVR